MQLPARRSHRPRAGFPRAAPAICSGPTSGWTTCARRSPEFTASRACPDTPAPVGLAAAGYLPRMAQSPEPQISPTPAADPAPQAPWLEELPPRQIVTELDRYIVGQDAAKRAVAIAIRNRWRRAQTPDDIRDEITAVQHHPHRPDRRGEDRGRPPAGPARGRAVRQSGGLEVHRGRLRRPRCGVDGARAGGRGDQHGPRPSARMRSIPRRSSGPRSGCWTSCFRRRRRRPVPNGPNPGAGRTSRRSSSWVPADRRAQEPAPGATRSGPHARARSCARCSGTGSWTIATWRSR